MLAMTCILHQKTWSCNKQWSKGIIMSYIHFFLNTGNATFKQQNPRAFSCKHQPKRNIRKIMGQRQNIITNPAFSLREAKKRRLLQNIVPQLISWKQHKKKTTWAVPCSLWIWAMCIKHINLTFLRCRPLITFQNNLNVESALSFLFVP